MSEITSASSQSGRGMHGKNPASSSALKIGLNGGIKKMTVACGSRGGAPPGRADFLKTGGVARIWHAACRCQESGPDGARPPGQPHESASLPTPSSPER